MELQQIAEALWIYEGSTVLFYGFPFPTRMSVIRLPGDRLWIHSPEKLNDKLQQALSALGEVSYLISPNKLHHLFLAEWLEAYPSAKSYAAPGLKEKRPDLRFDGDLREAAEPAWGNEIAQTLFRGSLAMEEAVFFHKASHTLLLTDLIENFDPSTLKGWQRSLARFAGILAPHGKTPIDWRMTFHLGDKESARKALRTMLAWEPENIILSHGRCIYGNATAFLAESFFWLMRERKEEI
jgi:hypothetical protein